MANRSQVPSFKTDVNRAKSQRWQNPYSVSYSGDDWGDDDEEFAEEPPPPPPPLPKQTGLRQRGQATNSVSHASDLESPLPQPPSQPGPPSQPHRMNSFDTGDDRRKFSSSSSSADTSILAPSIDATAGQPPAAPAANTHVANATIAQRQGLGSQSPPPAIPPATRQSPHNMHAQQGPPQGIYARPQYAETPRSQPEAAGSGMPMRRESPDFYGRRDFSPSAVPQPLQTRMPPMTSRPPQPIPTSASSQTSQPVFPPRKSSLTDSDRPTIQPPVDKSIVSQEARSPPVFIRPADIYKRMEAEKERERQSMDSTRPTIESINQAARMSPVLETSIPTQVTSSHVQSRSVDAPEPLNQLETTSPAPTVRPASKSAGMTTIPEVRSDPIPSTRPPNRSVDAPQFAAASIAPLRIESESQTLPQARSVQRSAGPPNPTAVHVDVPQAPPAQKLKHSPVADKAPELPQLGRFSTFGDSLWQGSLSLSEDAPPVPSLPMASTKPVPEAKSEVQSEAKLAPKSDHDLTANPLHVVNPSVSEPSPEEHGLKDQPSLGFRSAVQQAFGPQQGRSDDSPASNFGSQRSNDTSAISRSNTDSTGNISPIMSRVPSAGTAARRAQEAHAAATKATPPIAEESPAANSRPTSSNTLKAEERYQPTTTSPIPASSGNTATSKSSFARNRSRTPSPGIAPARSPELTTSEGLSHQSSTKGEILVSTPVDTTPVASSSVPTRSNLATREANLAAKASSSAASAAGVGLAEQAAQAEFLVNKPKADLPAQPSSATASRSNSPSKGRVRDLAGRYNEMHDSRRDSGSSIASWASSEKASSPTKASFDQMPVKSPEPKSQLAQAAAALQPPARPHMPGGWQSFATTTGSITPQNQPQNQFFDGKQETPSTEPRAAMNFGEPSPVPDFSPNTTRDQLQGRTFESGPNNPLAQLAAAGAALGDSLRSTVGLGRNQGSVGTDSSRASTAGDEGLPDKLDASGSVRVPPATDSTSTTAGNRQDHSVPQPQPLNIAAARNTMATSSLTPTQPTITSAKADSSISGEEENERLRNEIVRSLTPRDAESPGSASARRNDGLAPPSPLLNRAESTLIPKEYDSYWNESNAEAEQDPNSAEVSRTNSAIPAAETAHGDKMSHHTASPQLAPPSPAIARPSNEFASSSKDLPSLPISKPAQSPSTSSRPGLLDHRFSWEETAKVSPVAQGQTMKGLGIVGSTDTTPADRQASVDSQSKMDTVETPKLESERRDSSDSETTSERYEAINAASHGSSPIVTSGTLWASSATPSSPQARNIESEMEDREVRETVHEAPGGRKGRLSVSQVGITSFKDITAIKNPSDRLKSYQENREKFSKVDYGLDDWLAYMLRAYPEHAKPSGAAPSRPNVNTSLADSVRNKIGGPMGKIGISVGRGYDENQSAAPASAEAGYSTSSPGTLEKARSPSQNKGKDFFSTATSGAKGLFSKGRSRFRGSTDKAQPPPSDDRHARTKSDDSTDERRRRLSVPSALRRRSRSRPSGAEAAATEHDPMPTTARTVDDAADHRNPRNDNSSEDLEREVTHISVSPDKAEPPTTAHPTESDEALARAISQTLSNTEPVPAAHRTSEPEIVAVPDVAIETEPARPQAHFEEGYHATTRDSEIGSVDNVPSNEISKEPSTHPPLQTSLPEVARDTPVSPADDFGTSNAVAGPDTPASTAEPAAIKSAIASDSKGKAPNPAPQEAEEASDSPRIASGYFPDVSTSRLSQPASPQTPWRGSSLSAAENFTAVPAITPPPVHEFTPPSATLGTHGARGYEMWHYPAGGPVPSAKTHGRVVTDGKFDIDRHRRLLSEGAELTVHLPQEPMLSSGPQVQERERQGPPSTSRPASWAAPEIVPINDEKMPVHETEIPSIVTPTPPRVVSHSRDVSDVSQPDSQEIPVRPEPKYRNMPPISTSGPAVEPKYRDMPPLKTVTRLDTEPTQQPTPIDQDITTPVSPISRAESADPWKKSYSRTMSLDSTFLLNSFTANENPTDNANTAESSNPHAHELQTIGPDGDEQVAAVEAPTPAPHVEMPAESSRATEATYPAPISLPASVNDVAPSISPKSPLRRHARHLSEQSGGSSVSALSSLPPQQTMPSNGYSNGIGNNSANSTRTPQPPNASLRLDRTHPQMPRTFATEYALEGVGPPAQDPSSPSSRPRFSVFRRLSRQRRDTFDEDAASPIKESSTMIPTQVSSPLSPVEPLIEPDRGKPTKLQKRPSDTAPARRNSLFGLFSRSTSASSLPVRSNTVTTAPQRPTGKRLSKKPPQSVQRQSIQPSHVPEIPREEQQQQDPLPQQEPQLPQVDPDHSSSIYTSTTPAATPLDETAPPQTQQNGHFNYLTSTSVFSPRPLPPSTTRRHSGGPTYDTEQRYTTSTPSRLPTTHEEGSPPPPSQDTISPPPRSTKRYYSGKEPYPWSTTSPLFRDSGSPATAPSAAATGVAGMSSTAYPGQEWMPGGYRG